MKKIVLVGLAASVPALAAEPATPEIRRVQGGAPPAAARVELKDAGTVKIRPGAEIKLNESKFRGGAVEQKAGFGEGKFRGYGEIKSPASGEYKSPASREYKAPGGEYKAPGAVKLRGDSEAPPMQREAPVRY